MQLTAIVTQQKNRFIHNYFAKNNHKTKAQLKLNLMYSNTRNDITRKAIKQ